MHIVFRTDSSNIIGHGHVMRCLTLAHALLEQFKVLQKTDTANDLFISFICRDYPANINHLIIEAKFALLQLSPIKQVIDSNNTIVWLGATFEQDTQQCITQLKTLPTVDLLIVDHYGIDYRWHELMKPKYKKLVVIDDLANRKLACDYLLDQTYNRNKEAYQSLVPRHCQLLLGQDYMLLRNEFHLNKDQARRKRQAYVKKIDKQATSVKVLITMGGTDPDNISQLILHAINELNNTLPDITVNLVISNQSLHLATLKTFCKKHPWVQVIINSKNMAKLMLDADIAIGASGSTAWERCCLGLPCLTTINAENQQLIASNLAQAGAIINLGWHKKVSKKTIAKAIEYLLTHPKAYEEMTGACFHICDGRGANNVARALLS